MLSFLERKKIFEKNKKNNKAETKKENLNKSFTNDKKKDNNNNDIIQKSQTLSDSNPFVQMMNSKKSNNQTKKEDIKDNKNKTEKGKNNEKKEEKTKTQAISDNNNKKKDEKNKIEIKRKKCINDKDSEIQDKKNITNKNANNYSTFNPERRNTSTPFLDLFGTNSGNKEDTSESFDYFKTMKDDFAEFEKTRKFNSKNIDKGKQYFKQRYIQEKLDEIDTTIQRITSIELPDSKKFDFNGRASVTLAYLKSKSNNNYEKESEARKCQTEFLLIVEKAIISFNIKKYSESFTYLKNSGVIKNLSEFGEFLLVVSGFDKSIVGEFLAKEKPPNEKKEILNSFINAIDMDYKKINFLECLRFLLTRLILPKDANLILVIMDTFSERFFENNKHDQKFVNIFKSTNAVYLLVSTILALNTMFTRKDIKNMNVIKKPEFLSMNKDIEPGYVEKLYDELKKKPISLNEDYNEDIYIKLSTLVQVKQKDIDSKKLDTLTKEITSENKDKDSANNNNDNKKDNLKKDNSDSDNTISDDDENEIKKISTQNEIEKQYYDYLQDMMDLDIVRKTLRGNYDRKKSFSMNTNLLTFNEGDKKLLSKPNKFYRISGSSAPALREILIYDDFKKMALDKTIDVSKQKYKKFLDISDINDVHLGIGDGENIKKYLKAYPQEEKLVNNFISIVYNNKKEQIDIKTDDTSLALLWFKAMKSLILQTRMRKENKKIEYEDNIMNDIKGKIKLIWVEKILNNWKNYAKYIIIKCYEKSNYINSILYQPERQAKIDLLDSKKVLNAKTINDFIKEINDRLNKKENRLEYHEFFCLCYLGFPLELRKKIWVMCIENNLGLTKKLYLHNKKEIIKENLDFCKFDEAYKKDSNIQINPDYNLNKIIIDIIKSKYIFYLEIYNQDINENQLMQKVYNISVIFNSIRSDIPYNKGIVSLAYFFLLSGMDEVNSFKCIANLICSTNTIKFYINDKETIKKNVEFFEKLLKTYSNKVYDHLNQLEINPELYFIPWMEKLFTQTLDFNILMHVFDLYIINGEYILFQTAITIIKLFEEDLMNLTISEAFKILKRLPKKYTELDFFEKFKTFNCIRDEYIIWNKNNILSLQQKVINEK